MKTKNRKTKTKDEKEKSLPPIHVARTYVLGKTKTYDTGMLLEYKHLPMIHE